jgi:EAL domain-containing protein (putative c-di-GMP-specific phosphodiesterase class I)
MRAQLAEQPAASDFGLPEPDRLRSLEMAARDLAHADSLPSQVKKTLQQTGFPARSLTIEITESQVVTDHAVLGTVLRELRELGSGLSIDDFGTGFSSLTQLQRMPVTEVKIDRSFTTESPSSDVSPFVAGIVGLSHGLSLRVIAEGVETDDQLAAVRSAGCDWAQGYLLGRPDDAEVIFNPLQRQGTTSASGRRIVMARKQK